MTQPTDETKTALLLENLLMRQLIDQIERANHGQYGEVSDSAIAELIDEWRKERA